MSTEPPTLRTLEGRVVQFDFDRGRGLLQTGDGRRVGFHCTAIADGSRDIAVGTTVAFRLAAAPGGNYEAAGLITLVPGSRP